MAKRATTEPEHHNPISQNRVALPGQGFPLAAPESWSRHLHFQPSGRALYCYGAASGSRTDNRGPSTACRMTQGTDDRHCQQCLISPNRLMIPAGPFCARNLTINRDRRMSHRAVLVVGGTCHGSLGMEDARGGFGTVERSLRWADRDRSGSVVGCSCLDHLCGSILSPDGTVLRSVL